MGGGDGGRGSSRRLRRRDAATGATRAGALRSRAVLTGARASRRCPQGSRAGLFGLVVAMAAFFRDRDHRSRRPCPRVPRTHPAGGRRRSTPPARTLRRSHVERSRRRPARDDRRGCWPESVVCHWMPNGALVHRPRHRQDCLRQWLLSLPKGPRGWPDLRPGRSAERGRREVGCGSALRAHRRRPRYWHSWRRPRGCRGARRR